jgi:hypothetical protein
MNFRLICGKCKRKLRTEIKSVGILEHPDVRCVNCGMHIRSGPTDHAQAEGEWFPITDEQLVELRIRAMDDDPDDELHFSFALEEGEEDLGAAQDEICKAKTVRCKAFNLGVYIVQIYMNDHTPDPIFAGTVWRHDRWPSNFDIALALRRWRGPGAPEFLVEWYKEDEGGS